MYANRSGYRNSFLDIGRNPRSSRPPFGKSSDDNRRNIRRAKKARLEYRTGAARVFSLERYPLHFLRLNSIMQLRINYHLNR